MKEEEWRDIAGYEGKYQVSNLGHVKSLNYLHTGKEKILSPGFSRGYLRVGLYKNRKRKHYLVHHLVAEAFLKNPDNLLEINHKNEVKTDNSLSNLEWCTRKYNSTYNNLRIRCAKKCRKKVGCYRDSELIKVYNAIKDVENDGFYPESVCLCCKGKLKSTGGFQWKYIE